MRYLPWAGLVAACAGFLALPAPGAESAGVERGAAPGPDPRRDRASESTACGACHAAEFAAWRGSHHDRAMEPATAETVLGDFDDAELTHYGVTTRFFRRDGRFFVRTDGPDGQLADFEVAYTFGIEPLQQLLVPLPGGRLQSFPIAWDTQKQRWFHLYPDTPNTADDALHWTGRYQRWNSMCAECHSTNLRKRYDAASDTYRTLWDEIDVGCQACHGADRGHAAWARAGAAPSARPKDAGLAAPRGPEAAREIETCAPCHSRRHRVGPEPEATGAAPSFHERYAAELLREGLYFADGQIDGEVYVYGSFVQSAMHRAGVRCSDCHEPHALSVVAEGDALCTRCHGPKPEPRFPQLSPGRYDAPSHHHHPQASEGARCVSCHMPARTYMEIDERRDHSLRIPRPDLSFRLGTPNACNGCHGDRSARWAADAVEAWGGTPSPRAHFAAALHDGRAGHPGAARALAGVFSDPGQPAIARATAVELLAVSGAASEAELAAASRDPDAAVRAAAAAGLAAAPPEVRVRVAAPLLSDASPAVRVEAARALAAVDGEQLSAEQRARRAAGLERFEAAQNADADLPASHLNLALLALERGQPDLAERHYRRALAQDPRFLPAIANFASFYNARGRNEAAEQILRAGIEQLPNEGELHYSLALLLAETQRLAEAERALARSVELMPSRPRVRYNHALALQHLGRREEAERSLLEALALAPGDPDFLNALAIFYLQGGAPGRALPYAEQLAAAVPGAPGPQQLLGQIRALLAGRPR